MPADNSIYETLDDWWDPTGSVAGLHAMNPARVEYFSSVLRSRLGPHLARCRVLDVGCGGGLLTEALVGGGIPAIGVDSAQGALRSALAHGRATGFSPRYIRAVAESLPFSDGSYDAVVSSDFLEHVRSVDHVVSECARVIAAGGVFLFDTINRTWLTRLFHFGLVQEWRKLVPPDTHDWRQFVKPSELEAALNRAGLRLVEVRGLAPVDPVRFALRLLTHRKGRDRMPPFRVGTSLAGSYVGYAVK